MKVAEEEYKKTENAQMSLEEDEVWSRCCSFDLDSASIPIIFKGPSTRAIFM